ncbi:MAG: hypothetical protein OEW37_06965, partial [Rhodospirillaceae bacterium]|nr:hypothetical protein [Rhodospirillaceae bacterium]
MADVSLTSGMRANLLQLQMTERLMDRTQGRIATGKKVNSALDGPAAYFAAKALSDRAADLSGLKDNMGQAISTIKAADAAISKITSLVEQARAVANTANQNLGTDTASVASRKTSAAQYDTLLKQIDQMVTDASYAGKNLLLGVGGSGPYTATTDSVTAVDALTQISSTSVSGTSGADSYKVDVTTGQFGRIDSASTDYTNFTTSGSSTAAGNINSATISGMTITGTLSGTTNDVTMTVNNGTDNAVSFNISYGGASQIVTVTNAVANTAVSATVGGVTVSFSLDRSADNAVINTAAITLLDSSTTAQGTDQRITIDSTNDTTTGASGTVTLSSYANDASRTANSTLIADSAAVTQTFTTGTVNFTIGTAASLVNTETATLVTEG